MKQTVHAVILLLAATVMTGCASVKLSYAPPKYASPGNGHHNFVVGKVQDSRKKPAKWLATVRGGFGNPIKKVYTQDTIAQEVKKVLQDGMRARGILSSNAASFYAVNVDIRRLDANYYMNKEAHVDFQVTVVRRASNTVVITRTYRADRTQSGIGAGVLANSQVLADLANEALNEAVDDILRDLRTF